MAIPSKILYFNPDFAQPPKLGLTYGDYYHPSIGPSCSSSTCSSDSERSTDSESCLPSGGHRTDELLYDVDQLLSSDVDVTDHLENLLDEVLTVMNRTHRKLVKFRRRFLSQDFDDTLGLSVERCQREFEQLQHRGVEIQARLEAGDEMKSRRRDAVLTLLGQLRWANLDYFANLLDVDPGFDRTGVYDWLTGDVPDHGDYGTVDLSPFLAPVDASTPQLQAAQTCLRFDVHLIDLAQSFGGPSLPTCSTPMTTQTTWPLLDSAAELLRRLGGSEVWWDVCDDVVRFACRIEP